MKLLSLALENFQGIKELRMDFGGVSANIYGNNATGKTTTYNALTWLLFDKSSTGAKGFSPKPRTADGEEHNVETSVQASFSACGGVITLQKIFSEVYKKKRGSNVKEFDGHTVSYFVNGVPVKEKEYNSRVDSLCGDSEKAKMLTMPFYFPEMLPWADRRKILLDICGDVTDEEVIERHNLGELKTFLAIPGSDGHYSVEEYRKIAAGQRKSINADLQSIPARVDEAKKAIPELFYKEDYAKEMVKKLEDEIADVKEQKASALAGDSGRDEIRRQLAELDITLATCKSDYIKMQNEALSNHAMRVNPIKERISDLSYVITTTQNQERKLGFELDNMIQRREELLAKWKEVHGKVWEGSTTCQTCGQELPYDQIEELKSKFNLMKSREEEKIRKQGAECSKDKIAELQAKIDDLHETVKKSIEEQKALDIELGSYKEPVFDRFENTPEYIDITKRKADLIARQNTAHAVDTSSYDAKITALEADLSRYKEELMNYKLKAQQEERIRALEEKEEDLARQFEQTEKGLYLCDEFVRAKVSMLNDSINARFQNVKFQLFSEQINGGLKETCEVLIPSPRGDMVPFQTANNAARINAGMEIIGTLSKAWDIEMPVFIDNAESVTEFSIPEGTQVIFLVVSAKDKKLRMVPAEEKPPILEGQMDLSQFI